MLENITSKKYLLFRTEACAIVVRNNTALAYSVCLIQETADEWDAKVAKLQSIVDQLNKDMEASS